MRRRAEPVVALRARAWLRALEAYPRVFGREQSPGRPTMPVVRFVASDAGKSGCQQPAALWNTPTEFESTLPRTDTWHE